MKNRKQTESAAPESMEQEVAADLGAAAQEARSIPNPPGGGSWRFDSVSGEWVANDQPINNSHQDQE